MRCQIMGLRPAAVSDGSHPAVQVDCAHKADNREVHHLFFFSWRWVGKLVSAALPGDMFMKITRANDFRWCGLMGGSGQEKSVIKLDTMCAQCPPFSLFLNYFQSGWSLPIDLHFSSTYLIPACGKTDTCNLHLMPTFYSNKYPLCSAVQLTEVYGSTLVKVNPGCYIEARAGFDLIIH